MDMYKLKFTKLQNEILRLLCIKAGTTLNQRGISRLLSVSPTAVAKALPALKKESLVKIEKTQNMNLSSVELDRDNEKATAFKRIENLKMIYESSLPMYLTENFPGCTIILFGSYSLGEDTTDSDIDIAVIGSKEKETDLSRFNEMLERTVFLHYYDRFSNINRNLRANILNGITLNGYVEL